MGSSNALTCTHKVAANLVWLTAFYPPFQLLPLFLVFSVHRCKHGRPTKLLRNGNEWSTSVAVTLPGKTSAPLTMIWTELLLEYCVSKSKAFTAHAGLEEPRRISQQSIVQIEFNHKKHPESLSNSQSFSCLKRILLVTNGHNSVYSVYNISACSYSESDKMMSFPLF